MINRKHPVLAFFGHHKGATSWLLAMIYELCYEIGLNHSHFHSPKMFDFNIEQTIKKKKLDFFSFTNSDFQYVKPIINNIRGVHIIRDPRDIIISAYYSHLNSHSVDYWPELINIRKQLQNLSKDEGLKYTIETINDIEVEGIKLNLFNLMGSWDYSLPNIMEVKYEEIIKNPYVNIVQIINFWGILDKSNENLKKILIYYFQKKINKLIRKTIGQSFYRTSILQNKALNIIYKNDFIILSQGRKPGKENNKQHYRKGVSGDWKNHFNQEHKNIFKSKYNDLLIKLGYVTDSNW